MKILKPGFLILILLPLILINCNEFEDGPYLSLRSKESRACKQWSYEYIMDLETGQLYTSMYEGWILDLNNNGEYTKTIVYLDSLSTEKGTWEFDGRSHIRFHYNDYMTKFKILRLSNDEFWLQSNQEEIHLKIF
ncbi:MAG: hypothetical protein A2W91_12000 [Bacteroidetes bacterium GWF2_38_335]|nr:MAG: hypothetical protein A2W91_12000 [Bacteroidetes bacterium GWF2_38_335]OFY76896.1 MAG: hypothetical protein A2281_00115 [Bacteroidetes bacterium RIFOXYA12_FULL_38_20]HBS86744.1 hypothetical protein [Bacteroidales bacterium]